MHVPVKSTVRFADFELDLSTGELRSNGDVTYLQEKPFRILSLLLEHPGQLITREQLVKHLWPDGTFVDFDQGLNKAVNRLREALGDSADQPRFIETLSRRGYRFIAAMEPNGHASEPVLTVQAPKAATSKTLRLGIAAALAVVTVVVVVFGVVKLGYRFFGTRTSPEIHSIAVLPLQNLSADPAQEYFSDGITDALITELSHIDSVRVISRTSSMQYKEAKKSLPEIASELRVDGIVEGTVQRDGERVRITAQLIQGATDKHLWANTYERDLHDVFALEGEVTNDIADQVRSRVAIQDRALSAQPRRINLKALEAYLQGHYHLNKAEMGRRNEELRKASEFFQQAVDADPEFVSAYLGLSAAHHDPWWPSNEDFEIFRASAAKALELSPNSSEAHRVVGLTKAEDWDWAGAKDEFMRAIQLNPNNAAAHHSLGELLDMLGKTDDAWKQYEAAQQIDPDQDHLSAALHLRGQYAREFELLQSAIRDRPDDAELLLSLSENYAQRGLQREWVQAWAKSITLFGFPDVALHVQHAFSTTGYRGALRVTAQELERLAAKKEGYLPGILAKTYAQLGDNDRAFYWLQQGCEHRHMAISDDFLMFVEIYPGFAPLRSDARFRDVLRCMGLPS
jgi:TolB-like protein/DNA-binding winged helix-turn-helix (wHTH) protein/lipoprotein NlpI